MRLTSLSNKEMHVRIIHPGHSEGILDYLHRLSKPVSGYFASSFLLLKIAREAPAGQTHYFDYLTITTNFDDDLMVLY